MQASASSSSAFNILAVLQSGRLQYEAVVLAASLRKTNPGFGGTLYLAEPQPGPRWHTDPRVRDKATLDLLRGLGAEIIPFENKIFGDYYPYGNKIEALSALPDAPFLFLDTDTLITGDLASVGFDFTRPSASMRREGTWPEIELYGPDYTATWRSLYDRFGLDFASSLDLSQPDEYWQRYLYFNAGWFFHESPLTFGAKFADYAREIRDNPPPEVICQNFDPWLDQVALPLVIHALGGGRPGPELDGLDGAVTCHYRTLPLLYARESDLAVQVMEEVCNDPAVKKVLREYEAFRRMVYQPKGRKARALFDRNDLPRREQQIRNILKQNKYWFR